jgi:hypothetical protein
VCDRKCAQYGCKCAHVQAIDENIYVCREGMWILTAPHTCTGLCRKSLSKLSYVNWNWNPCKVEHAT